MNRYKVTKIGLLNFWLYDEEEYDFYGGKLILRGANGSGKSVTMQSFIPLILDGNKSPERLDPFGSKERKIEDYVLGIDDYLQKEESTAYLYMETYNSSLNKYLTIGLGFRGRKGRPVESWGFALKDGARIGHDFYLYKDPVNKIPISKNELKSRLGTINEFWDNMKDYKAMVNRLLFGFPNLDAYDEFIKLLLQLRSNKLSKDFKPTNLINVLNSVLQPLTEEDLRPLAEAIEQMNKTKIDIELLEKSQKSVHDFLKVYNNYNESILLDKTRRYKEVQDFYNNLLNDIKIKNNFLKECSTNLENNKKRFNKVIEDIEVNKEKKEQLDDSDLKQKIESLASLEDNIKNLANKIEELEQKNDTLQQDKLALNNKISTSEDEIYKLRKEIKEVLIDLKDLSNDAYSGKLVNYVEMLENDLFSVSIDDLLISLKNYKEKVTKVLKLLEEENDINLESEKQRIEFAKLTQEYQELEKQIMLAQKNLTEAIMAWQEDFINKEHNNNYLKLTDYVKKQILELMNDYTKANFEKVVNIYKDYAQDLINGVIKENLILQNKIDSKKLELSTLEEEYHKLENQDDLEIPSLNKDIAEILKNNKIENIPLYKCLEFKNNISDTEKNNIESLLLDLNILNALVIKPEDIDKLDNIKTPIIYLTKSTKKKDNILKYFNIVIPNGSSIKESYLKEILESISINPDDLVAIDPKGKAKMDMLNFLPDYTYKQKFIGFLKRLELKKKQLAELQEKITLNKEEINNINSLIVSNENKIEILRKEQNNIPNNDFIKGIENNIEDLKRNLNWTDKKQKEVEESLKIIDNNLKKVKTEIMNNKEGLVIPLNIVTYQQTLTVLNNINEIVQSFHVTLKSLDNKLEIQKSYQERLEDVTNNIEYSLDEQREKNKELQVIKAKKATIEEILETKEFKEQKNQLLEIEKNLHDLTLEKDSLIKDIAKLENELEHQQEKINELNNLKEKKEKEANAYQDIFLREYKLGYVYQEDITNISDTVKRIINAGKDKKEIDLNSLANSFFTAYNKYSLELNDYYFQIITIFEDYEIEDKNIAKIYQENKRIDITTLYQGIKLNIFELKEKIDNDILANKDLINEQDRRLFEEILLNTVGEKIRNKINDSNEWIKKINDIIAEMQKESALSFKLVWKSINAESEDEIDTKELVRILKMDPHMLKEVDAEKLTNHFRSKIKKAEELYQDSYASFTKIIEEILDYRSWFTFQLCYQRKGNEFKELTDKTFAKFSGGERAKSMYIPLFASVYAKLFMARSDSLRLIALDEAFAGVDEENIREMFGILKKLDLDFIINSQVLWGDYDTIDDLSMCELIKPPNSLAVSVERYRWNGKYKEIIVDRKKYNEEHNA